MQVKGKAEIRRALEVRSQRLARRLRGIERELGLREAPAESPDPWVSAVDEIVDAARHERWLIEAAIARMERGDYGCCRGCGREIDAGRLQALPYAARCAGCCGELDRDALGHVRLQHLALDQLVAAIRASLLAGSGEPSGQCARSIVILLADLANELPEHFELEERGGYLADVIAVAPRLAERAARLQADHASLRSASRELSWLARGCVEPEDWSAVRADFTALAERLSAHEDAEKQLIQEASGS